MTTRAGAAGALLSIARVTGTLSDRPLSDPPLTIAGYRVLAGDFHIHPSLVSAAAMTPWDLVLDARRQRLDVIAITPHNAVFGSKIGRWFAARAGGPLVLTGEEIRGWSYHLIAVGIDRRIAWTREPRIAVDAVHAQGGVAIVAHPEAFYAAAFDQRALAAIDGAEVVHPAAFQRGKARREFRAFYARPVSPKLRESEGGRRMTAIGSSDFHGLGRLGMCRTYVFAKGSDEAAVLDALRRGRTIVYDEDGAVFGDPELIRAAAKDGRLPERERERYAQLRSWDGGVLAAISRIAGVIGLLGLVAPAFRPAHADRQP
jgi:predicted metal-dependent phosphoesterase TrpH